MRRRFCITSYNDRAEVFSFPGFKGSISVKPVFYLFQYFQLPPSVVKFKLRTIAWQKSRKRLDLLPCHTSWYISCIAHNNIISHRYALHHLEGAALHSGSKLTAFASNCLESNCFLITPHQRFTLHIFTHLKCTLIYVQQVPQLHSFLPSNFALWTEKVSVRKQKQGTPEGQCCCTW